MEVTVAVAAGAALFGFSCWLVPSDPIANNGFVVNWKLMSVDPTALDGRFPHRVLAPIIAWLTGFGADDFLQFTHGLHVVLLASVFFFVRCLRGKAIDALLVTLAVAISAPTQMYKQLWNGYPDPLGFSLFLWAMLAARRPYLFWSLFFVNLLHHEMAGFLLPWLWYLRRREDQRWRLDLACAGTACAVYAAFYLWVTTTAQPILRYDYYLEHPLFPGGTFVVWNLAAVHWTCAYGPLLAVLAWHQHRRGRDGERLHLWLVLLSILAIYCVAFDWSRQSNLIVLPLVIAATRFVTLGTPQRLVFTGLLAASLLLFLLVPPWDGGAWPTNLVANIILLMESGVVIPGPEPGMDIHFGPLRAALGEWLPAVWRPLLILHAILAAIWIGGALLARWQPGRGFTRAEPPPASRQQKQGEHEPTKPAKAR